MALVELARFNNRVEADLARLYLGSHDIEAILFDAETNNYGLGPMMPVRLMVLDEDFADATSALSEYQP